MSNLSRTVQMMAPTGFREYTGVIVRQLGILAVNVNGNVLPARWADPVVVSEGDSVLVRIKTGRGLGEAFVLGRLADRPRPGTGVVKVVPPGSPTITVTGSDGTDYAATFVASYTPVATDPVLLSWNAAIPSVTGKITTTPAPPPPPPTIAPPSGPASGSLPVAASDSDTYWASGGWGSWAGGKGNVFQGDYGSGPVYGSWFYAGSFAQLAGRNINAIIFTLGSRLAVGSNNAPATVHFYAHTSPSKPGGDVSRTVGPFNVTAQPGQGPTEYSLDLAFAPVLLGGGGISIAGLPYAGFTGCRTQANSGHLRLDWSK